MDVDPDSTRAMKTFMRVPRYGQAVGRIMVREAGLLNWQRLERLIESDFDECLSILRETDYGSYLEGAGSAADIDGALTRFLTEEYSFIEEVCEGTSVAEMLRMKYDFHNIKVFLKRRYFEGPPDEMLSPLGRLPEDSIASSFDKPGAGNLPAYFETLLQGLRDKLERSARDPGRVDLLVDRAFLERRLDLSRGEKSRFLVRFARATVDVANIRTVLRGREMGKDRGYFQEALAEGGKLSRHMLIEVAAESQDRVGARLSATRYGEMLSEVFKAEDRGARLSSLDRESDEYLLRTLATMARVAVGPERIFRYAMARENEVVTLRVILMGKLHSVPARAIEDRLPRFILGGAAR